MTDAVPGAPAGAVAVAGPPATPFRAFAGLLRRDLRVQAHNVFEFLVRTLMQPVLFVFVFTYLFPKIGQGFSVAVGATGGASGAAPAAHGVTFATILVPGLVGIGAVFAGITTVALPLSVEFGATNEIEDRIMAPLPAWAVGFEKIVYGALNGLISAVIVFPLVYLVPATPVSVHVGNWPLLIGVIVIACLTSGALGLALGSWVQPQKIGLLFGVLVLPLSFLGCVYYPWARLGAVRWLQVIVLVNPIVYVNEGLRAALTPGIQHMPAWAFLGGSALFCATLLVAGLRLFMRRVVT